MRAALCLLVAASSVAHAEDYSAAAKAEAHEAESLAAAQSYVAAAAKFRAAYRLDPKPAYVCNVGVAYQRAKDLPHAHIYLRECQRVGQSLDVGFLKLVRTALDEVEASLRAGDFAPVDISVAPTTGALVISSFERDEAFVGAHVVWLPFGTHTIEARADGYTSQQRTVEIQSRVPQNVRFELTRVPASGKDGQGGATLPLVAGPKTATRSKVPPLVATGATVVLAAVAVGMFVEARSVADSAGSPAIGQDEYDRRVDSTRAWQHGSWAFAGLAGVGAIASTYLWLRASKTTTVEVTPDATGASVSLAGRW
jgi:hypothetical protein